jgi:hypothetical protein
VSVRWGRSDQGVLGWLADRLGSILPSFDHRASSALNGDSADIFLTTFEAPVSDAKSLRRAAELALPQLMPIAPEDLIIYGRTRRKSVELAAIKHSTLEDGALSSSAFKRLWLAKDWVVLAPRAQSAHDRRLVAAALGLVVAVGALIYGQIQTLGRLEVETNALLDQEARIRADAKSAAARRNDADLWASLTASHPDKRTPAKVLASIAILSKLTQGSASWTKLSWGVDEITIEGIAKDPVSLLGALSSVEGMTVRFSRPVTPQGDGRQLFAIVLGRKGVAAK